MRLSLARIKFIVPRAYAPLVEDYEGQVKEKQKIAPHP
jgi:hypothetical protein